MKTHVFFTDVSMFRDNNRLRLRTGEWPVNQLAPMAMAHSYAIHILAVNIQSNMYQSMGSPCVAVEWFVLGIPEVNWFLKEISCLNLLGTDLGNPQEPTWQWGPSNSQAKMSCRICCLTSLASFAVS